MPFQGILKDLVENTPGATGAILLDWEGERVADFSTSTNIDLPAIGAHKGIILNLAKETSLGSNRGNGIKTIGISTELTKIALSTVKDGYYVVITLDKAQAVGRAFFESKKAIRDIEREMG